MYHQKQQFKIALVGDSLSKGGAEKVHAILSNYFFTNGFEVHNCILIDAVTYQYSGTLLNLGEIKMNSSSIVRKIHRFWALQKWVRINSFDCLIDFRMRPSFVLEFLLSKFVYPQKTIYTVHSGVLEFYFPRNKFLSDLIYKNRRLVTVSKGIRDKISENFSLKQVETIYNPINSQEISVDSDVEKLNDKFILVVGSMDSDIKQIDKLIVAYAHSNLPNQNIKLIILGDGLLRLNYQQKAEKLHLSEMILFQGIVSFPFAYYKKALFTILCSKNEGFPNVLLESLASGTPVVAFDCFSGPNEIISNYNNGILVENQNLEKLIEAMNLMCSDSKLYARCKQNAAQSVEKFSIEIIGKQWIEFIKF